MPTHPNACLPTQMRAYQPTCLPTCRSLHCTSGFLESEGFATSTEDDAPMEGVKYTFQPQPDAEQELGMDLIGRGHTDAEHYVLSVSSNVLEHKGMRDYWCKAQWTRIVSPEILIAMRTQLGNAELVTMIQNKNRPTVRHIWVVFNDENTVPSITKPIFGPHTVDISLCPFKNQEENSYLINYTFSRPDMAMVIFDGAISHVPINIDRGKPPPIPSFVSLRLCICLFVCLPVCLAGCLSAYLFIYLP
eukprot:GHVU01072545.1.p1 GENE.GHVU01072545.1~~GHVU01072545.1.p1  ORF type:complete len:247 (+),score=5.94 GHVU01072545.1:1990-2730(+)